jgi:hypothetical protein
MTSFQSKFDNLVKDFCKEVASTYGLNDQELFSIWKGEKVNTIKKFLSSKSDSESKTETKSEPKSKTESKPEQVSKPANESTNDPDLDITRDKIMLANKDMLAAMCKKKGLKMSGKKEELVQRLIDSLSSSSSSSSSSYQSLSSSVPSHLSVTAKSSKGEESSVIKSIKSTVSDIAIRRNKYGNFEHMQTGLVFNTDKLVYGRQVEGEVIPLTVEDIESCKKYKFAYKLPENLNINKSLDDIKIDEVEEEEELDDDDLIDDLIDDEEEVIDDDDK